MNREDLAAMIAVMQGALDGKLVECRVRTGWDGDPWRSGEVSWDWARYEYRLKPEPRRVWVNEYRDGGFGGVYSTRDDAERVGAGDRTRTVELVEVLP